MVDVAPLGLTEVTAAAAGDFYILELAGGGTRRISQSNAQPSITIFPALQTEDVNIDADTIFIWDGSNGRPRQISVKNLLFGNFGNEEKDANFTLAATDAIQAQEINNVAVTTITLDGNAAEIGGADFVIVNFLAANISLAATNITMFVDGVSTANATIRSRRSATITVNNASSQALFSGG